MADRSVRFDFLGRDVSASRTAKKVAEDFEDAADKSERAGGRAGRRFFKGLGDGVDEGGGKDRNIFQRALKKAVTPDAELFETLKHTMARTLSTPLGLGIAAGLTTALAGAIPSAILAASGVGLVAIGAFALRGSKILKTHFKAAGSVISTALTQAAQPLKGPFLQAIETVTGAMKQLQPTFRSLFKGVAPSIRPLVDGLMGLVRNVLPGLQAALPGINAAFAQIGNRLPGLGKTIGNVFAAISANLPAIQRGIDLMFTFTEVVLNVSGAFMTLGQSTLQLASNPLGYLKNRLMGVDEKTQAASKSSEQLANDQGHLAIAAQKAATAHQAMLEKAKATRQAFYQERAAVASVIPIFDGYSNKSTVTKGKILSNLRQEVNAYKNWAANAQALLRKGADPQVVKALSDKGPQYVAAFVHASGRELRQLNGLFKSRTQAAGSVAIAAAGAAGGAMGRAATSGFNANFHPNLRVGAINPGGGGKGGKGASGKGRRPAPRSRVLAGGGILHEPVAGTGLRTGTSYLMGEKGPEAVVPLKGGRGGGGNITVNVYAHPASNPKEVGAEVYKVLKAYMSSNRTASLA